MSLNSLLLLCACRFTSDCDHTRGRVFRLTFLLLSDSLLTLGPIT